MSQKDYDMKPRWYVVHTYSGYENKVKANLEKTIENRNLEHLLLDIQVPMEEVIEEKDGKQKVSLKKKFPGYVCTTYHLALSLIFTIDEKSHLNLLHYSLKINLKRFVKI